MIYIYPYLREYNELNEKFQKIKFDSAIYDISKNIISEYDKAANSLQYRFALNNSNEIYSGWSYDSINDEVVEVYEKEAGKHPIYLKYIWGSNINNVPPTIKPIVIPSFYYYGKPTMLSTSLRKTSVSGDKENIVINVYLNTFSKLKQYLLHPLLLHEFRHIHDMFRVKNVNKYNSSLNVRYADYLDKNVYRKWNVYFSPHYFDNRWKLYPAAILMLKSQTEIKARVESIDMYVEENQDLIKQFFKRHSENIGLDFFRFCSDELCFNDSALNGIREDITYNINIRNYLLPIFITSVLMNEGLLGEKDETGFSDFKYFHDYQKHKFNITEEQSLIIQKMFSFVTKTVDTYIKILSRNCEKILKKYNLYDELNEQNIIDFKRQYFRLNCSYSIPNDVMDDIISRRLNEELVIPSLKQAQIESNLELIVNGEINKID